MPNPRRKPATSSTDALRRSGRGAVQTVTAASIIALINVFASHPLSTEQALALTPILGWLLSFIQNYLEDAGAIGTFMKGPAEPPDDTTQRMLADLAEEFARLRAEAAAAREPSPRISTRQVQPDGTPFRG